MLNDILIFIAGFGVFLFGIQTLSSNLEKIGGNNMRKKLNRISSNRFSAIGFGFAFTTLFQSSTASIVMIAGFTSAGMISLFQGIALTIGSNIASTVPNFLISFTTFNIKTFFCALAAVGFFMFLFSKKTLVKNIAIALIGFSLLFIGMELMSIGTSVFKTDPAFINFFSTLTNPILLILLGAAFTCITQSSLATIAIIITLVGTATAPGAISISSAACLVYGANLGTAITTSILASFSSNIDGKRIGIFHIFYAIVGVIIFGFLTIVPWIDTVFSWVAEPTFKVAFINLSFNLVVAIIMLPFIKPLAYLVRKIMPGFKKSRKNPLEIDEVPNELPAITIAKANEKIVLFFDTMISLYNRTVDYIAEQDNTNYKKLFKDLSEYNMLINKFNIYVVRISTTDAYESVNKEIEVLLNTIKQVERINRNCLKILAVFKNEDKKITFSSKLKKYIDSITENTLAMLNLTKQFIQNPDCKFLANENPSSYEQILNLTHENSETKLAAKKFIIEFGFNTKTSTEKNTAYIEALSYLGLVSNNILDIIFAIVGRANHATLYHKYEQLILEGMASEEKENLE